MLSLAAFLIRSACPRVIPIDCTTVRSLVQIGAKTDPQLADVAEALIAPNVWCANVVEVIIQKLASCSRAWLSRHMFA